jgi:hypothetical protein
LHFFRTRISAKICLLGISPAPLYEALVTVQEVNDSFDYGCYKFVAGVIVLKELILYNGARNMLQKSHLSAD